MPELLENQECPVCHEKKLTLQEHEMDIPFFGKSYIFSMTCDACKFHKADVESTEEHPPARYTIEVGSEEDMKIRVVKSSQATIKIPHIVTITPGLTSNGYVTNVEGILNRVKNQIESVKEDEDEDDEGKKKARNLIKKLNRVMWGQEKLKIIIEDPSGNSAIISDRAEKSSYKPATTK